MKKIRFCVDDKLTSESPYCILDNRQIAPLTKIFVLYPIGIDPKDKEHSQYLKKLADDFVTVMSEMITNSVNEKAQTEDLLVNEIYQHISFCQNKCKDFYGREDMLKVKPLFSIPSSVEHEIFILLMNTRIPSFSFFPAEHA